MRLLTPDHWQRARMTAIGAGSAKKRGDNEKEQCACAAAM